jgi:hypothetical protein
MHHNIRGLFHDTHKFSLALTGDAEVTAMTNTARTKYRLAELPVCALPHPICLREIY